MKLSLAWKAAALILLNVVLTFSAGLLARNYVLNPELAKIELINDKKVLHQLEVIEDLTKRNMAESVNRIKVFASRVKNSNWVDFAAGLTELAASSDISFAIAANSDGSLLQVRPGSRFNPENLLSPAQIALILKTAAKVSATDTPLVNLITTQEDALVVAIDRLPDIEQLDVLHPSVFIAVNRINGEFIARVNRLTGVDIRLINQGEFSTLLSAAKALSGLRTIDDELLWSVRNLEGERVIMAAVSLPPRSYDDQLVSPTLAIALLITLLTWCIAIWLIHRTIIRPMNQASATLQEILQDKDYARQLHYRHRDEFGRLVAFCNQLLGMVNHHTNELEMLSLTDPLTELGNRRAFDIQAQKYWALAERNTTRMALIAFDIDYFKSYNDRYGHPAGDKVIASFAGILERNFKRGSDVVARVGGEEFLVVTQDTPAGACQVLTNRVLQDFREMKIEHADNPTGFATVSAGVFQATPDVNLSLELALNRADEILYSAKQQGRNRAMHSDALVDAIKQIRSADIHRLPGKT